ncbi:hypothetical protein IEO70_16675 [Bacillus sp. AGMB 02131]|uniref:Uncharacterized protein n=1 Tax=Peribacillus faecalis TaxID=2772559 RepID=A0A927CZP4_9BACI|nr:hypothetical protein [Peribacillus faecalis]MBD3109976.1 hypothetical protein [Peribacillus faecalis]
MKEKAIFFVAFVVVGTILFPLLDWLWCKFLTHSAFELDILKSFHDAVVFGIIFTIIDLVFSCASSKGGK